MIGDIRQKLQANREGVVMITGMVVGCAATYLVMRQPLGPNGVGLVADTGALRSLVEQQLVAQFTTPVGIFKLVPPPR